MFLKNRVSELEEQVDDIIYDTFCDLNPMNLKKRVERLELFKGKSLKARKQINILAQNNNALYELYELLGQKVKNNKEDIDRNKVDVSMILIALLKHLGLSLDEQYNVIKNKKDASTLRTSVKINRKKSK